jgi:hypothetical protein
LVLSDGVQVVVLAALPPVGQRLGQVAVEKARLRRTGLSWTTARGAGTDHGRDEGGEGECPRS